MLTLLLIKKSVSHKTKKNKSKNTWIILKQKQMTYEFILKRLLEVFKNVKFHKTYKMIQANRKSPSNIRLELQLFKDIENVPAFFFEPVKCLNCTAMSFHSYFHLISKVESRNYTRVFPFYVLRFMLAQRANNTHFVFILFRVCKTKFSCKQTVCF